MWAIALNITGSKKNDDDDDKMENLKEKCIMYYRI